MIAYNNDSEFRSKFLAELRWHRERDRIVQGTYGKYQRGEFRGCAVGCGLHSLDRLDGGSAKKHREYGDRGELAERLGISAILVYLEDHLFEGLPIASALDWPLRFASAAKAGADLSLVWPRFAYWLLVDPAAGVILFAKTEQGRSAVANVAALFADRVGGREPIRAEWEAVRHAAFAAVNAAAVVNAAVNAAAAAAAVNAAAVVNAAAYQQHYQRMADKLCELMEACR